MLESERDQLSKQLDDQTLSPESRVQVRLSIRELDVAVNVIDKQPLLANLAEVGLIGLDAASAAGVSWRDS